MVGTGQLSMINARC